MRALLACAVSAALVSTSAFAESPRLHPGVEPGVEPGVQPGIQPGVLADASQSTPTEVLVLHATQAASPSIDPRIGNLPQLTKPPFSKKYNTYKFLDRKSLAVERGKAAVYTLPTGRLLQVTVEPAGTLYRVTAAISKDKSGGEYLKVLEVTAPKGEPFFVAGQAYDGGALVIALTIK